MKFEKIFQTAFYLIGKHKEEVNLLNSNVFNWRKFQEETHEELFASLRSYQYEGIKEGDFKKYNKVDNVSKMIEALDSELIKSYSYPFFLVHRLIVNFCQLRVQDIKKRKDEVRIFNKIREMKLD